MYNFNDIFENKTTTESVARKEFFSSDGTRVIAEMWVIRDENGEAVNGGCGVFCNGIPAHGITNYRNAIEIAKNTADRLSAGESLPEIFF